MFETIGRSRGTDYFRIAERLGRLIEEGSLTDTIAAIAKMNNTRKARQVIAEARDLLGGNGILLDFHVMRHMADIESPHTYEGTETIQTLIVGRDITGVGAFTYVSIQHTLIGTPAPAREPRVRTGIILPTSPARGRATAHREHGFTAAQRAQRSDRIAAAADPGGPVG